MQSVMIFIKDKHEISEKFRDKHLLLGRESRFMRGIFILYIYKLYHLFIWYEIPLLPCLILNFASNKINKFTYIYWEPSRYRQISNGSSVHLVEDIHPTSLIWVYVRLRNIIYTSFLLNMYFLFLVTTKYLIVFVSFIYYTIRYYWYHL